MQRWIFGAFALLSSAAAAQPADYLAWDDENAAYCLGVNRQFAETFRQTLKWRCGAEPSKEWCRDAQTTALRMIPETEKAADRLVKRLADRGVMDGTKPETYRKKAMQMVINGAIDVVLCFPEDGGTQRKLSCEAIQKRCPGLVP